MKIQMPENVKQIIATLEKNGYEAYIVGGCVRDAILEKRPMDWDITTSAKPNEIKKLFRRTIDTGIEHGTVTVMIEKEGYEVTTYRVDGEYEDHRRPKTVFFTSNLLEDLKRRDFTMNAMAYNESEGLQDPFGGREDLERGVIRCVGVAEERFDEDALRILRALRFSSQLNFNIEKETKRAMKKKKEFLKKISVERIQVELTKLLCSNYPEKIYEGMELGIIEVILPELENLLRTIKKENFLKVMGAVENRHILRYGILFSYLAKENKKSGIDKEGEERAKSILKTLKFDNDTIKTVGKLVKYSYFPLEKELSMRDVRWAIYEIGTLIFPLLLQIKKGKLIGAVENEKLVLLENVEKDYLEIIESAQCVSLKQLKINGSDLKAIGITEGIRIGGILQQLLERVLDHPEENEKERLLEFVK